MRESLRFTGKIVSATISRAADKWYVSVTVESQEKLIPKANESQVAVGIDLGLSTVTLSTGNRV